MRAGLDEMRRAVDTAAAYLDVGNTTLADAVDVACDHLGVVDDADRRVVRKAVTRKRHLQQPARGSAAR